MARDLVLVLGQERPSRRVAGSLMLIGHRAVRAADAAAAVLALGSLSSPPRAGLVSAELADAADALRAIHGMLGRPLVWALVGARPAGPEAAALRAEQVRFVLDDAYTEEELRFVLHEAAGGAFETPPRGKPRVPTPLRARVVTKTGERVASVWNLSTTGAYLATPRPTLRGGRIDVHLGLPAGSIHVAAEVLWNNVPGNLRRPGAPVGMGVRFAEAPADAGTALDAYVAERIASYRL
jgi:hypothetical protein